MNDDYQKRLEEARRYSREYNRNRGDYGRAVDARGNMERRYGQRPSIASDWQPTRFVSLPRVSILNTDADIDPADLKAGEAAARAAGLS